MRLVTPWYSSHAYFPGKSATGTVAAYLTAANAAVTATPCTMAAWCNPLPANSLTIYSVLEVHNSASASSRNQLALQLQATTAANFVLATASSGTNTTAAPTTNHFHLGHWFHAAAVFNSDTSRTPFCNGEPGATSSTSRSPSGINSTSIGVENASTKAIPFAGVIAHAAIWNAALTNSEVMQLAMGVCPLLVHRSALVSYWPLYNDDTLGIDYVGSTSLSPGAGDAILFSLATAAKLQKQRALYLVNSISSAATWKTTLGLSVSSGIKTVDSVALANIKADLGLTPR